MFFVPEKEEEEDSSYLQTYHLNPITNNQIDELDHNSLKTYDTHLQYPHDKFIYYAPPKPSNNVPSVVNPVIPSYENEASYLSGLLSDIFKANNINYLTIGVFLAKIILFQKLLLSIAMYCIISLHASLKTKGHHRDNLDSEETARFDVYNICSGNWIND